MRAKLAVCLAAAALLAGCASVNYQPYEGRNGSQVVEGSGGTKEVIDGFEVWDNGNPPRRYQVLGVVSIEDSEGALARVRMRSALVEEIKKANGDAAVVLDASGSGSGAVVGFNSRGTMATGFGIGRRQGRWQIVKYLDKPAGAKE